MKLLGRNVDAREVWEKVEARLQARGLLEAPSRPISMDGPEPFVDPLSFHLSALEAHADPSQPLPVQAATTVPGKVANVARWAIRAALRPVIEEVFARQHLFNAHVRDAYAQLSAEVIRLRETKAGAAEPGSRKPPAAQRSKATAQKRRGPARGAATPKSKKPRR